MTPVEIAGVLPAPSRAHRLPELVPNLIYYQPMRLHGVIELQVPGERVLRQPNIWDKVKRAFGGEPDLRTDKVRASLEATAIVEAARAALRRLGASNAVSLVVDDQVLFQDREGRPDDLGDLFLAFHDNAPVFGGGFSLLRLAVEHQEAGLHLVIELVARSEHPVTEAAARVVIGGRIQDFEPRPGEDAEAYRSRVEPLTRDAARLEAHRRQFESFVSRVEEALRAALPEARVQICAAEAQIKKPSGRPEQPAPPTSPNYDPYANYYRSPFDSLLSVMMWSSLFSMMWRPDVVVINDHGERIGDAQNLEHDASGAAQHESGAADMDGNVQADGDFGGDDFGGGDFGGIDF
jgi:hypothetical protein